MENILYSQMTPADITKLRIYIERAVRIGQFYGDFRRIYRYAITPWQYRTMISYRMRGALDDAAVKAILQKNTT